MQNEPRRVTLDKIHGMEKAEILQEQNPPTPNQQNDMWLKVIADMKQRRLDGIQKYGTPVQPFNGRSALIDAYQEALDLCVYLRQAIEESMLAENAEYIIKTAAGRALRAWAEREHSVGNFIAGQFLQIVEAIAAIEKEAAEAAIKDAIELRKGVEALLTKASAERDAARDGWDALLAQTLAIRPIIDAEIARRDRIAAGDKTAGSMPPAEWDALASLPATANLPARYLRQHANNQPAEDE